VIFSHRPFEVRLDSAVAALGFEVEIKDLGPDEVDVKFEGEDTDYRIRAYWEYGLLVKRVEEEGD